VAEAMGGEQLAISVEGAICGKSFGEGDTLYVCIRRKEADELLECCSAQMSDGDKAVLQEILAITDRKLI
jgi:hypothetical protein